MQVVGRFAPSPSGRIHLGNMFCSLLAWLSVRSKGGQMVLRIEDLDTARCPRRYADQMEDDLRWLGLDWDIGPGMGGPDEPYYQSERTAVYQAAREKLENMGLVYPCFCTRGELHAASAPHRSDGQVLYAGTCRHLTAEQIAEKSEKRSPALRLRVPDEVWGFTDGHMGVYEENLEKDCGDFLLRRSDGMFAYQLAVVVDDAAMDVTEVVRAPTCWIPRPVSCTSIICWGCEPRPFTMCRCCWLPMDAASASGTPTRDWTSCGSAARRRRSSASWRIWPA